MLNRVIFSDNGTLTDRTKELNNYHSDTVEFTTTADEDYLYISSELPFNHLYFDVDSSASTAMTITPQIYDGTEWNSAVDYIDETNGITQSGFITWTTDKDEGWGYEDTEDITALSTIVVYEKYWMRLKLGSSDTFSLNWVGNRFANDYDLADIYPALNSSDVKTSFAAGKTDWDEQHILSAVDIINKLKSRNTIIDRSQILERRQLITPSVHKLAAIIFNSFGDAYVEQRDSAMKAYMSSLSDIKLVADKNLSGNAERSEVLSVQTGELYR